MKGSIYGDVVSSNMRFYTNNDLMFDMAESVRVGGRVHHRHVTDASILSMAVQKWLIGSEKHTREDLVDCFKAEFEDFSEDYFSPSLRAALSSGDGTLDMKSSSAAILERVAPVAQWAQTKDEALDLARVVASVTHDSEEGIRGAESMTSLLYDIIHGDDMQKEEALSSIITSQGYSSRMREDDVRALLDMKSVISQSKDAEGKTVITSTRVENDELSIDNVLVAAAWCVLNSSRFELALRESCSLGGRADKLAPIVGALGEAYFGNASLTNENDIATLVDAKVLSSDESFTEQAKIHSDKQLYEASLAATQEKNLIAQAERDSTVKLFLNGDEMIFVVEPSAYTSVKDAIAEFVLLTTGLDKTPALVSANAAISTLPSDEYIKVVSSDGLDLVEAAFTERRVGTFILNGQDGELIGKLDSCLGYNFDYPSMMTLTLQDDTLVDIINKEDARLEPASVRQKNGDFFTELVYEAEKLQYELQKKAGYDGTKMVHFSNAKHFRITPNSIEIISGSRESLGEGINASDGGNYVVASVKFDNSGKIILSSDDERPKLEFGSDTDRQRYDDGTDGIRFSKKAVKNPLKHKDEIVNVFKQYILSEGLGAEREDPEFRNKYKRTERDMYFNEKDVAIYKSNIEVAQEDITRAKMIIGERIENEDFPKYDAKRLLSADDILPDPEGMTASVEADLNSKRVFLCGRNLYMDKEHSTPDKQSVGQFIETCKALGVNAVVSLIYNDPLDTEVFEQLKKAGIDFYSEQKKGGRESWMNFAPDAYLRNVDELLDPGKYVEGSKNKGRNMYDYLTYYDKDKNISEVLDYVKDLCESGDRVVFMSNTPFPMMAESSLMVARHFSKEGYDVHHISRNGSVSSHDVYMFKKFEEYHSRGEVPQNCLSKEDQREYTYRLMVRDAEAFKISYSNKLAKGYEISEARKKNHKKFGKVNKK